MSYLDLLLRLVASVLLVALIALLVRRKLRPQFPFFFIYSILSILGTLSGQIASSHPVAYFIFYWSAQATYAVFALLVIREVFHHVFRSEYRLLRWMRFVLPITVIVILGFSIYQGIQSSAGYSKVRYVKEMIYWFDLGVHTFQAALLLLLIGLRAFFAAEWLRYEFGILSGLGCNAIFAMSADLLWFEYGSRFATFFQYGPPVGYILATLIWLQAFFPSPEEIQRPDHDPKELLGVMREQWRSLAIIRKWLRRNRPFQFSR